MGCEYLGRVLHTRLVFNDVSENVEARELYSVMCVNTLKLATI